MLTGLMLLLMILSGSCASLAEPLLPRLEQRTLRIDPNAPGFVYQYRVCVRKVMSVCFKHEMRVEKFDLSDPAVRKQLIDVGFVARVREKL